MTKSVEIPKYLSVVVLLFTVCGVQLTLLVMNHFKLDSSTLAHGEGPRGCRCGFVSLLAGQRCTACYFCGHIFVSTYERERGKAVVMIINYPVFSINLLKQKRLGCVFTTTLIYCLSLP